MNAKQGLCDEAFAAGLNLRLAMGHGGKPQMDERGWSLAENGENGGKSPSIAAFCFFPALVQEACFEGFVSGIDEFGQGRSCQVVPGRATFFCAIVNNLAEARFVRVSAFAKATARQGGMDEKPKSEARNLSDRN